VNQKQINIVQTQVLERLIQGLSDSGVVRREDLGGNENLLTSDLAGLNGLSNAFTDLLFVLVNVGGVNVADASLGKRVLDGSSNLTFGGLPGAKAKGRDGGTIVKSKSDVGHCDIDKGIAM